MDDPRDLQGIQAQHAVAQPQDPGHPFVFAGKKGGQDKGGKNPRSSKGGKGPQGPHG